jgi:hypothetical protein
MKTSFPKRKNMLPSQSKKSKMDDPKAHERIHAIMTNPHYIPADQDSAFLRKNEVSGVYHSTP